MANRKLETSLAKATIVLLIFYVPLETWSSLPGGLLNPFFLVDVVAMVLMVWGVRVSLAQRPDPAPEILCIAFAWSTANAWRAASWRIQEVLSGGALDLGTAELWVVTGSFTVSLCFFLTLLWLVVRKVGDEVDER